MRTRVFLDMLSARFRDTSGGHLADNQADYAAVSFRRIQLEGRDLRFEPLIWEQDLEFGLGNSGNSNSGAHETVPFQGRVQK